MRIALLGTVALLAACSLAPQPALPKPDINGSYLFWTPDEQLVGYRNIEKIFPTHMIRKGSKVAPLPRAAGAELTVAYQDGDAAMTTDSFMEKWKAAGVLVIHEDQVVLERYAHGYGPGQRWTSFSMGKSISSTLAGAALKDGKIRSIEDKVTDYLPGLKGSAYEGVTVRNLLNMTSGVKWNEDYADPDSDVGRIRSAKTSDGSDPIVAYMKNLPREAAPGTKFVYKTGETHLVGSLVRAATGRTMSDYLSDKIWKPYGMETDAVWMLDTSGGEYAGCCISATLRDFGRFAIFFKNGAKVDGVSVVPDGWVKDATTPSRVSEGRYGYQWWTSGAPRYFQAQGIFGQTIQVDTQGDTIIVIQSYWPTSLDRPSNEARGKFIDAVRAAVAQRG